MTQTNVQDRFVRKTALACCLRGAKFALDKREKRSIIKMFSGQPDDKTVGVDCGEGPPVPIPNTEVKLICADDTWRVTARENR